MAPPRLGFTLRALRSHNYRLFFGGQGISLIGTWMTRIATAWPLYRLTKSPFLLGATSFASQIPILFLTPFAGVWVDRWGRRRTLLATQALSMLQSFALAALALGHMAAVWHIMLLQLFQGVINAFDMPARQAFVVQMVENRADLSNAIALNSSLVNGARIAGPAVAGLIISAVGEGYCFLLDGVSYIAVIASLLLMRVAVAPAASTTAAFGRQMAEGWHYVAESVPLRSILLLLALISIAGMPYTALMPVVVTQSLHGGAHTLGLLMAASGVGALASAITLASRRSVAGLERVLPMASALFGAALIAFAFSRNFWLSAALMLGSGFGFVQEMAASNTMLQTLTEESKRGRVMAYFSMAFQGVAPIGSLLAGAAAQRVGAPWTLAACGSLCLASAAWFCRQLPEIRRAMEPQLSKMGILQEGK